jgi:ABC-2 type transport system permease protein
MNNVTTIARKELRAYFLSPIALIFVGTFLFVTLFAFFWVEQFFARNIADVRPLFSWLPILLIFLCSALTMRLWSEEQKVGTLEVLQTLPVKTTELVAGKFLASLGLVAVALVLTFGVPITVSMLGDLDWGPVVGGYLAALLLAGAYLAVGLWVSSLTENQIIALIGSVLICGALYLLGSDILAQAVGNRGAEVLSDLGTGSRFESIRRGVVDIRDLVYYAGLIITFLALNVLTLRAKTFSEGQRTRAHRTNAFLAVGLIAANVLLLNVNLAGVSGLRADLTERGEYTISDTTKRLLKGLSEPLLIRGYFSEKTHPLLAPMVPRIRDIIEEYGVIGGGRVRTEYVDPRQSEELEKEAAQLYGIKSFPFRVADRLDEAVVNSYFSILVKYGDQHEVLNFSDLIEVTGTGMSDIEVKLRNLEYDLTKTIKKVAYGFQTVEALFDELESPAKFHAFVTPDTLPGNYQDAPDVIRTVAEELEQESDGKFSFEIVNPDAPGASETRESLRTKYGFRPYALSLLSEETFFLHLVLQVGDRYERVAPGAEELTESDLREAILDSLKRAAPGFLKTVGLAKPEAEPPNPNLPPQLRQQQTRDMYRSLRQVLSETYTVEDVDLASGRVPSNIDVLMVVAPSDYDQKQRFAIDQFLMRGGSVLIFTSQYELDPAPTGAIRVKKVDSGLDELLAAYGVTVEDEMVMDLRNEGIPVPVERNLGGFTVREFRNVNYPFFVDVRQDGISSETPVGAGLPSLTMPFASPVTVVAPSEDESEEAPELEAREATALLQTSPDAWTTTNTEVQPDFATYPDDGFAVSDDRSRHELAVLLVGSFDSAFADENAPVDGETVVKQSPPETRLAVIGSTSMVNDMVLQLSQQAATNLQLAQNLVDWGVEDTDLLSIRSRSTFARTLVPMDAAERAKYEYLNYGIAFVGLLAIVVITASQRRRLEPIELDGNRPAAPTASTTTPKEAHS